MDFAAAWDALSIGDETEVSDGTPPPSSNTAGLPYMQWRSHNFTGALVEKIDGPFRAMRFQFTNELGNLIGYAVQESVGHSFTAAGGGGA